MASTLSEEVPIGVKLNETFIARVSKVTIRNKNYRKLVNRLHPKDITLEICVVYFTQENMTL